MELNNNLPALEELDTVIFAISTDDLSGARSIASRVGISFPVLYDPAADVVEARGAADEMNEAAAGEEDFDLVTAGKKPVKNAELWHALIAAAAVLVPLQCEFFALEGISHLVHTIERIKKSFNPSLEIQGIVLTMYDQRNNLSGAVANDVRAYFGDIVYNTVIPRNVRVSEAPSHGKPVLLYDTNCAGAQAYIHLASEVLKREHRITG